MSLAGSFLVARPILQDPSFVRTVVLLLAHNEEGAFGLVVNRPAKNKGIPFPLFVGGPCPSPGLMVLHGHAEWRGPEEDAEETSATPEVAPGIFVGDESSLEHGKDLLEGDGLRLRVFSGYAGWGSGQLEGELAVGAWAVAPASGNILFDTPTKELWEQLVPPTLPQPSLN
jgi:putative transcriptional regulator